MKKFLALLLTLCLLLCGCSVEIVFVPEVTAPAAETAPVAETVPLDDTLTVHYIDVGQADAILLECGGEFMMIDGGNRDDGQLVVSYLQSCGVEELKAVSTAVIDSNENDGVAKWLLENAKFGDGADE